MVQILAIDQGTTSTRAMVFELDPRGAAKVVALAQQELPQHFPHDGWVEHDASEIWQHTLQVCREALAKSGEVIAIGITNQRETTVVWDRATGEPIYPAIVWQDRRTSVLCDAIKVAEKEPWINEKTGLLCDPYFSATKLGWILDNVPGARAKAERGELAFGTIDCWLVWKLTEGRVHATDATNASRTLLFNIHRQEWDKELLKQFRVPEAVLPEVKDSAADYGTSLFGIPIRAVVGDQQAAAVGQACLAPGSIKSTYGTGCFVLFNTGAEAVASKHRLLTTVALRLAGEPTYALEGSIFVAGAAVQWLRDGLKAITKSSEVEALASTVADSGSVVMVPAFTGLGAPYWDAGARGAVLGLTRDSTLAHIARATLEAVAFETEDLLQAMQQDTQQKIETIRVDGGMARNDLLMQFLADLTGCSVERPAITETTALGAAYVAALGVGFFTSLAAVRAGWRAEKIYTPRQKGDARKRYDTLWRDAVKRVRTA